MFMKYGIIIFDEFFFMAEKALEAIIPTLATGAALVIISSLPPDRNIPSMYLLDSKYPDGTDALKKLNWIDVCLFYTFIHSSPSSLL